MAFRTALLGRPFLKARLSLRGGHGPVDDWISHGMQPGSTVPIPKGGRAKLAVFGALFGLTGFVTVVIRYSLGKSGKLQEYRSG